MIILDHCILEKQDRSGKNKIQKSLGTEHIDHQYIQTKGDFGNKTSWARSTTVEISSKYFPLM